jgi:hypothetical protein
MATERFLPTPDPDPVTQPAQQVESPVSQSQVASQPEAAPISLRDRLGESGYDQASRFGSDEEFVSYLREADQLREQFPQYQRMAAYGQQVLPYAREFEQWRASQQAAAQPAVSQPQGQAASQHDADVAPYWPVAPEWRPEWEQYLALDERGQVVIRPEYQMVANPAIVDKYQEYKQWRSKNLDKLLSDPVEAIWPELERRFKQTAQSVASEQLTSYRQQQFANSFAVSNQDWLYVQDPNTAAPAQHANGTPVLSEAGQMYIYNLQRAEAMGVRDPQEQAQLALELTQGAFAGRQTQAAPVPSQPAGASPPQAEIPDMRERFLSGNGHAPNRTGTLSNTGLPRQAQNDQLGFRDALLQKARDQKLI